MRRRHASSNAGGRLALLCLFLATCTASVSSTNFDKTDSVIDFSQRKGGSNNGLAKAAVGILKDIHRLGGPAAPRSLSPFTNETLESFNGLSLGTLREQPYLYGILFAIVFPFAMAIVTALSCLNFCLGRCCCNNCGHRESTRKYSKAEINFSKWSLLLLTAVTLILFIIGVTANTAISGHIDEVKHNLDAGLDYVYEFRAPITSLYQNFEEGIVALEHLSLSPDAVNLTKINETIACIETISDLSSQQDHLALRLINVTSDKTALAYGLKNISVKSVTRATLNQAFVNATDELNTLSADFDNLDIDGLETKTTSLNTALTALNISNNQLLFQASSIPISKMMSDSQTASASLFKHTNNTNFPTTAGGPSKSEVDAWYNYVDTNMDGIEIRTTNLKALNTSMTAVNTTGIANNLQQFQTHLQDVSTVVVRNDFQQLQQALQGTTSPSLQLQLNASTVKLAALQSELADFGFDELQANLNIVQESTAALGSNTLQDIEDWLLIINGTIAKLLCLENALEHINTLNSSLDVSDTANDLSETSEELQKQLNDIKSGKASRDIVEGIDNVEKLNGTVSEIPEFNASATNISALYEVSDAVNQTSIAVGELQQQLLVVPLQNVIDLLDGLNNTLVTSNTALDLLITTLGLVETFRSKLPALITASETMDAERALVKQANDDPAWPGLTSPTESEVKASITTFETTSKSPAVSQAHAGLETLIATDLSTTFDTFVNGSMTAIEFQAQALKAAIEESGMFTLLTAANNSVATLSSAMETVATSTTQGLDLLFDAIGNTTNTTATLDEIDLVATIEQLQSGGNSTITDEDIENIRNSRTDVENLDDVTPDTAEAVTAFLEASIQLQNISVNLTVFKQNATYNVNYYWVYLRGYDVVRLVFAASILVFPFLMALITICGCFWGNSSTSMFMGLSYFGVMIAFFVACGLQMIPAIIMADNCPNIHEIMKTQLSGTDLSESLTFLDLQEPADAGDIFEYLTQCSGDKPELVSTLQNPSVLIGLGAAKNASNSTGTQGAAFNATEIRQKVIDKGIKITPELDADLIVLEEMQTNLLKAAERFAGLFTCERVSSVYQPVMATVCTNFTGSLALSTCLFFLFGVCLAPGIVVGVQGYKRFNKKNKKKKRKKKGGKRADGDLEAVESSSDEDDDEESDDSNESDDSYYTDETESGKGGSGSGSGSSSGSGSGSGSEGASSSEDG